MRTVTVINYGRSNLLSVRRALEHCGAAVRLAQTPAELAGAEKLVLPGVGAFADGMAGLEAAGLVEPIRAMARRGVPLLGICLGMQMLLEESDESDTGAPCPGLGLIPGRVQAIPARDTAGAKLPVPNIGWRPLAPAGGRADFSGTPFSSVQPGDEFYFVHGYSAHPARLQDALATAAYGGHNLCAAVWHGSILGTQFHPEKSAAPGLALVQVFVNL